MPWDIGCSFDVVFGGIFLGYVGRGIVYEEKDVSLLPGQSLILFVQPMFKDNCSHPLIAVVVVVEFKLGAGQLLSSSGHEVL